LWITIKILIPPNPILTSIVSGIFIAFSITKIFLCQKDIRKLKLGREGEKAVGEFLDRFREKGYRVFHDIVGGDFNIDHVLIGNTGIYTIETKTISKSLKGSNNITYDGEKVMIGKFDLDRNPIVQAKAQANWLKELINDLTGKEIRVQPVVLYPGWFVNKMPKGAKVWVLNPKALPKFLENEQIILDKNRKKWSALTKHQAPHKPFLLLSIMDLIDQGSITQNFTEPPC